MGLTDPSKQRREPPPGARTKDGLSRVSPAWRLRTRSCSHDNELYRMGLDKNADGDWEVVRSRVPQSLVDAMRAIKIRSARNRTKKSKSRSLVRTRGPSEASIKEEPESEDERDEMVEVATDDEYLIDLTNSTDVLEEILNLYLDVDKEVEGGHAYVDKDGKEAGVVMRTVEVKTDSVVEMKMGEDDVSKEIERDADSNQQSFAAISKEDADRENHVAIDLTAEADQEQPIREPTFPARKRRTKWAEDEIHYIGALSDGGYDPESIIELFGKRFPERLSVSKRSVMACRSRKLMYNLENLRQSRSLAEELRIKTGQWSPMALQLEEDDRLQQVKAEQSNEREVMMIHHKLDLELLSAELRDCYDAGQKTIFISKICDSIITQRAEWRGLMYRQCFKRSYSGLHSDWQARFGADAGEDYLAQLTIMACYGKKLFEGAENQGKGPLAYISLIAQTQKSLKSMLDWPNKHKHAVSVEYLQSAYCRSRNTLLLYEYEMAMLLATYGPFRELLLKTRDWSSELNAEVIELLLLDIDDRQLLDIAWRDASGDTNGLRLQLQQKKDLEEIARLREEFFVRQNKRIRRYAEGKDDAPHFAPPEPGLLLDAIPYSLFTQKTALDALVFGEEGPIRDLEAKLAQYRGGVEPPSHYGPDYREFQRSFVLLVEARKDQQIRKVLMIPSILDTMKAGAEGEIASQTDSSKALDGRWWLSIA